MAETPIDLTLERLNRLERLVNQSFDQTDNRLASIETAIGKMVGVLRARSVDTNRMADLERLPQALQDRQPTT